MENKEPVLSKWALLKDAFGNYVYIRKNYFWLFAVLILNTLSIISETTGIEAFDMISSLRI